MIYLLLERIVNEQITLYRTVQTKKGESKNWMSKQELMEICKCSTRVLEQIVADLSCEIILSKDGNLCLQQKRTLYGPFKGLRKRFNLV